MRLFDHPVAQDRNLRILASAEGASYFGDALFNLAVVWTIYSETSSLLITALVQVAWHTSDAVAAPLAGIFADRYDRKRLMVTTSLISATAVFLFLILSFQFGIQVWLAIPAILVVNFSSTFYRPARASVLPEMVGSAQYPTVLGGLSVIRSASDLIGTGLGGVLIARYGALPTIAVDGFTFLLMGIALNRLRIHSKQTQADQVSTDREGLFSELSGGWRVIWAHPLLRVTVVAALLINASAAMSMLYPGIVKEQLGGDASILGLIGVVTAIAGIGGGLIAGRIDTFIGTGMTSGLGWMLSGAFMAAMGLSRELWITLASAGLLVFFLSIAGISGNSLIETSIPTGFRGRAFGIIRALAVVSIPPVTLIGGWLADNLGAGVILTGAGVLQALTALWVLSNRPYRHFRLADEKDVAH